MFYYTDVEGYSTIAVYYGDREEAELAIGAEFHYEAQELDQEETLAEIFKWTTETEPYFYLYHHDIGDFEKHDIPARWFAIKDHLYSRFVTLVKARTEAEAAEKGRCDYSVCECCGDQRERVHYKAFTSQRELIRDIYTDPGNEFTPLPEGRHDLVEVCK